MTLTSGRVRKYRPLLTEDTGVIPKRSLGGLHHSLVTNCLKGRHTFFIFNEVYLSYLSNVYRACLFFMNLDLFCIDNAHAFYRKIQYIFFKVPPVNKIPESLNFLLQNSKPKA